MSDPTITLSFSTINNCLQLENSHNWLNKQMGVEVPDYGYFQEGKDCHRIIQDHVADIKTDPRLAHIPVKFSVVETVDKDPKTHFVYNVNELLVKYGIEAKLKHNYNIHGYLDGRDDDHTRFLEIKSSSSPWSLGQFVRTMQRKIYSLDERMKESWLITCTRDPETWERVRPKYYKVPLTEQDRIDALKWILSGIMIIETANFSGGLEDGKCTLARCAYGHNCRYK